MANPDDTIDVEVDYDIIVDLVVYIQGVPTPAEGGKRVEVYDATAENVANGVIENERAYRGSRNNRIVWFMHYNGGTQGYGINPAKAILDEIENTILLKSNRILGKVMIQGSSVGAEAALEVAQTLSRNQHVDYLGIHDGAFYKRFSTRKVLTGNSINSGDPLLITPYFDTSKVSLRRNWYQLYGNTLRDESIPNDDDEVHGMLADFKNTYLMVVDDSDLALALVWKSKAAGKVHIKAVTVGEKESDMEIKKIINSIRMP